MSPLRAKLLYYTWRAKLAGKRYADWMVARIAFAIFAAVRWMDVDRASALFGRWMRRIGPLVPAHKTGHRNLRAAFPEKSDKELQAILGDVWENLGRTAAEYPHLDEIWDYEAGAEAENPDRRISVSGIDIFERLRDDGIPAMIFAAHLGNWELPAVCAAAHGLPSAVVYRVPNNRDVARRIRKLRAPIMGELVPTNRAGVIKMASALERGLHLGMLVDQRRKTGPKLDFFGRAAATNPMFARLARQFDCPIHGVRVRRLDGVRFRVELTDEIVLPRDEEGLVDVEASMALINSVVEGWICEDPGQWLWLHRRWD